MTLLPTASALYFTAIVLTVETASGITALPAPPAAVSRLGRIEVFTEDFAPYQYQTAPGKVAGIATKFVTQLLDSANIPYRITVLPWFRSHHIVTRTANTLIYSIARTEDREQQFHWLLPLCSLDVSFFRHKDQTNIAPKNYEQAKQYQVAVASGQPTELFLLHQGYDPERNLTIVASHEQGAGMLEKQRVDLLFSADLFVKNVERELALEGHFERIFVVEELSKRMYLAANIESDPALVRYLQRIAKQLQLQQQQNISEQCDLELQSQTGSRPRDEQATDTMEPNTR